MHKESESHAEPHCEHISKERNDEQNIESNGGADRKLLIYKKHLQSCRCFFLVQSFSILNAKLIHDISGLKDMDGAVMR